MLINVDPVYRAYRNIFLNRFLSNIVEAVKSKIIIYCLLVIGAALRHQIINSLFLCFRYFRFGELYVQQIVSIGPLAGLHHHFNLRNYIVSG